MVQYRMCWGNGILMFHSEGKRPYLAQDLSIGHRIDLSTGHRIKFSEARFLYVIAFIILLQ